MDNGLSTRERTRRIIELDMGISLFHTLNDPRTVEHMLRAHSVRPFGPGPNYSWPQLMNILLVAALSS
jgi:hypothetical protein